MIIKELISIGLGAAIGLSIAHFGSKIYYSHKAKKLAVGQRWEKWSTISEVLRIENGIVTYRFIGGSSIEWNDSIITFLSFAKLIS